MAARPTQDSLAPLVIAGNRLTLLSGGPQRLEALIALIEGARHSLRILFYMFKDDESGRIVRDALLTACNRGVSVFILIDGFGSEGISDAFFRPLIDGNCSFCRFEPRWGRRYLLRNHQKLALADDTKVLAGGFNISDEYFGSEEEGAWRDLGIAVEGPAVARLCGYYDDLFGWTKLARGRIRDLRRLLKRHSSSEGKLHWLFGGPTRRLSPWARSVKRDMQAAMRLDLVAAYFSPNWAMLRRISRIAQRGQARIITPAKSDNGATIGAARHTYWRMLKRGVEIYEYQPTKMHTKLIIIDDAVHIGSANFDMRSLFLNLEMMLRVDDQQFAQEMRNFVDGEIQSSRPITREQHRKDRTWFNRVKWGLCYFVVATMDYSVSRRLNFGIDAR